MGSSILLRVEREVKGTSPFTFTFDLLAVKVKLCLFEGAFLEQHLLGLSQIHIT